MRPLLFAALSLFAAFATCSAKKETRVSLTSRRGTVPPHMLYEVMASAGMAPACRRGVDQAVQHLNDLGADLTVYTVEEEHPSISLEPRVGEIAIHAGIPQAQPRLSEVYVWADGAVITRAEIVVGWCSSAVIGHDLAHLLDMAEQLDHEKLLHADEGLTIEDWPLDPKARP